VNGKGLVCKRTRELPAFEEECESFEKDEELERLAPPKPEDFPVSFPYYTSYKAIVNRFFANIEVFFRATSI